MSRSPHKYMSLARAFGRAPTPEPVAPAPAPAEPAPRPLWDSPTLSQKSGPAFAAAQLIAQHSGRPAAIEDSRLRNMTRRSHLAQGKGWHL